MPMRPLGGKPHFTLIECLTLCAIVAILGAIVVGIARGGRTPNEIFGACPYCRRPFGLNPFGRR